MSKGYKKINLGCGLDFLPDYLNVDISNFDDRVDKVMDLNIFPYKLESNYYSKVRMINVLEHLKPMPYEVFNEIYRICEDEAIVEVEVPFCHSLSANSADHVHRGFIFNSFDTLITDVPNNPCKMRGQIICKFFRPSMFGRLIPKIPLKIGDCKNLRDVFAVIFNEVYTHIYIRIKVFKYD